MAIEHPDKTRTSRTTPRRPKRVVTGVEFALAVESQHCRLLTLHWLIDVAVAVWVIVTVVVTGFVVGVPQGVATARTGSARTAIYLENNIVKFYRCLRSLV